MNPRIPPLLEPYLALPPEASLILLTSVLGASTNWLVLRHLYSALAEPTTNLYASAYIESSREFDITSRLETGYEGSNKIKVGGGSGDGIETAVVLVSFLRDLKFWQEEGRRLGLDLAKLATRNRFTFVDGLSELFSSEVGVGAGNGIIGKIILRNAKMERVCEDILGAIRSVQKIENSGKVLLIIDSLDFLLATGGPEASAVKLGDMVMDLREHVHATILTLSSDSPLALRQQTPLEINHAAFLLSLAHQAYLTISLRLLDTGTARDVSGVIRIEGGVAEAMHWDKQAQAEAKELLYFVSSDSSVRVFERGQ